MEFPSIPDDDPVGEVTFDVVDVEMPILHEEVLSLWLSACAKTYNHSIASLGYILCSDAFLLQMNVERLNHNTLTDIITFDLRDTDAGAIEGECYISVERVAENAQSFGESTDRELRRVFVHGLLHLCGLGDTSIEEASAMRSAENSCLSLYDSFNQPE